MSCPCGSPICDCRAECLCVQDQCQCNKCSLLPKICSRCNLPFYIIVHQRENVGSICSCKAQNNHFLPEFHVSQNSLTCNENTVTSYRRTQCPRCSLPIIIVSKSEDYHSLHSCCCSHRNSDSNTTGTLSEHETSNYTSDHRDISGDRQTRKTSQRTRTEKCNWQYKKTKGKHLTNSDESSSDAETPTSEEFLPQDLRNPVEGNPELDASCSGSATSDSNIQSPTGFVFKAEDSLSLFANTSEFYSPSSSKYFISPPESPGFFQLSQNARPKLPPPFPTLPKPIPGQPAFRTCGGRNLPRQMKKSHSAHPSLNDQPTLARAEKMEKWFETLESVLTTSGEIPDAKTAALLDKKHKEKIEQRPKDHSNDQFESKPLQKYRELFRSSKNCGELKSATNNQKIGEELDFIDPTTDTERSSSLSKSRKESESD